VEPLDGTAIKHEYRVWSRTRDGREVLRREGPFGSKAEAEAFAAHFTLPKFVSARVEERDVTEWRPVGSS
jgi:hypothetical protein